MPRMRRTEASPHRSDEFLTEVTNPDAVRAILTHLGINPGPRAREVL